MIKKGLEEQQPLQSAAGMLLVCSGRMKLRNIQPPHAANPPPSPKEKTNNLPIYIERYSLNCQYMDIPSTRHVPEDGLLKLPIYKEFPSNKTGINL